MNENKGYLAQENTALSTKDRILFASIRLFSQNGYNEVTIRNIAQEIGINSSTIYFHFDSKKALLDAIFEYYGRQWDEAEPDIGELLHKAETDPPEEVLMKMLFDWKPEIQETMNRIYVIATREAMIHHESMGLIKSLVMDRVKQIPTMLLERLVELGRIEPVDIDAFVNILSYMSHSTTALNLTPLRIEPEIWLRCWNMLLSVIKPTGK